MNQEIRARKRTEMDGEIDPEKEEVPVPVAPAYAHNKKWFLYNIYFNAILYSSCFWVQIGVMPVSTGATFLITQFDVARFYLLLYQFVALRDLGYCTD